MTFDQMREVFADLTDFMALLRSPKDAPYSSEKSHRDNLLDVRRKSRCTPSGPTPGRRRSTGYAFIDHITDRTADHCGDDFPSDDGAST